jgi:Tol biopolymer transport system component
MPRIADALERESRTVDLEPGDFERLLGRRERKQRNRRIRAGALGVIVALAMGTILARSLTLDGIPADRVIPPKPLGAGEVLIGGGESLVAQDPDSGEMRTIVDARSLPGRAGDIITGAAWSSDRRWVAFRRAPGSVGGSLWVTDTIGGTPRRLATGLGSSPWAWSPNEDELVVVRGHDVILIDAATGRETDLRKTAGADAESPSVQALVWSPDGSRIVYDGGGGSVHSIDVESGEHSLFVRQPAGAGQINDIDWSPDGAYLAISYLDASYLASHPGAYNAAALYLADSDGSDLRLVDHIFGGQWPVWHPGLSVGTGPSAGTAAWSPEGTRLAYTTYANLSMRKLQVWTVSADGSAPSLIASHCCVSDGGSPVWSPDGSQIAFEAEKGGGTPDVRSRYLVVNADGTGEPMEIDETTYLSWAGGWFFCRCYG